MGKGSMRRALLAGEAVAQALHEACYAEVLGLQAFSEESYARLPK